jgi:hypothetical protein
VLYQRTFDKHLRLHQETFFAVEEDCGAWYLGAFSSLFNAGNGFAALSILDEVDPTSKLIIWKVR